MSEAATAAPVATPTATTETAPEESVPLALRSGKGLKAGLGAFDKIKAETPGAAAKTAEVPKETKEAAPPPEQPKTEKKAYKVKFGDKEVVFDDDEKIQRTLAKAYGAEQRFEEAAKQRAEAQQIVEFLEALKADPANLRHLYGEDGLRKLAIQHANEFFTKEQQEAALPPEAREMKRLADQQAAELQRYRQMEIQQKEQAQRAQEQAEIEAAREEIGNVAAAVLEHLKLPADNTPLKGVVAKKLIPYLQANLQREQPLDPQSVAADYLDDTRTEFAQLAQSLEGEQLLGWLGEEVANKIRLYDLGRLNGGPQAVRSTPTAPVPAKLELPKTSDRTDPIDRITRLARGY